MIGQWQIRKAASRVAPHWTLHAPDGSWIGKFDSRIDAVRRRDKIVKDAFDEMALWLAKQRSS